MGLGCNSSGSKWQGCTSRDATAAILNARSSTASASSVGCSDKCQCTGCANTFGVKGAAQPHSDSPEGTSGGSGETLARWNGSSANINDDMASQSTEASISMDDIHIPSELSDMDVDLGPPNQALGDGGLEDIIFNHSDFQHNVDPQTHEGFAKQGDGSLSNDANSLLQQGP
uniref:Uncharacterized protein n=1 Tax=Triticum urartu TaxID=4572 RepID=A0A8R7PS90_TRIUA